MFWDLAKYMLTGDKNATSEYNRNSFDQFRQDMFTKWYFKYGNPEIRDRLTEAQALNYLADADYRKGILPFEQSLREAQAKNYLADANYRTSALPYDNLLKEAQAKNYLSDVDYKQALLPFEQKFKEAQAIGILGDLNYKQQALNTKQRQDYNLYVAGLTKQLDYLNKAIEQANLYGDKQMIDALRLQQAKIYGALNNFLSNYRRQLGLE